MTLFFLPKQIVRGTVQLCPHPIQIETFRPLPGPWFSQRRAYHRLMRRPLASSYAGRIGSLSQLICARLA